jgi:hypothetical protein
MCVTRWTRQSARASCAIKWPSSVISLHLEDFLD